MVNTGAELNIIKHAKLKHNILVHINFNSIYNIFGINNQGIKSLREVKLEVNNVKYSF